MTSRWAKCGRRLALICGLFLGTCVARSQSYPYWFLHQGEVQCPALAVGYANPSFYRDSAIVHARRNGVENFARMHRTRIAGGQAYWSTEAGTYWMGSNFREEFDTAFTMSSSMVVLDSHNAQDFVVSLLGDSSCVIDASARVKEPVSGRPAPGWTESPPRDEGYHYAVGVAPEYYYETSSWIEAERLARRNLARNVSLEIKSLQKVAVGGQDIRHEELDVTLRDIEVVARWRDVARKIMYVLLRTSK